MFCTDVNCVYLTPCEKEMDYGIFYMKWQTRCLDIDYMSKLGAWVSMNPPYTGMYKWKAHKKPQIPFSDFAGPCQCIDPLALRFLQIPLQYDYVWNRPYPTDTCKSFFSKLDSNINSAYVCLIPLDGSFCKQGFVEKQDCLHWNQKANDLIFQIHILNV